MTTSTGPAYQEAYRSATAPYRDTVNQLLLTPRVFKRSRRHSRVMVFGFGWMLGYMLIVGLAWMTVLMCTVSWDFVVLVGVGVWFAVSTVVREVKERRHRAPAEV